MRIIIPLLLALLGYQGVLWSQTALLHPVSGTVTDSLSPGTYLYFDSGGPDSLYPNNQRSTITLCASEPDAVVRVLFTNVEIEVATGSCNDFLRISGDPDSSGDYCGDAVSQPNSPDLYLRPGSTFMSALGGCLTFEFQSDTTLRFEGWRAIVDVRAPTSCSCDLECGETLICDNFEGYAPWALTPQSSNWLLSFPGAGDGTIINTTGSDGKQSLQIETSAGVSSDVALLLGNRTDGRYRLSWNMQIPMASQGQFQVQHTEAIDNQAYQVRLSQGIGSLFLPGGGNAAAANFPYTPGEWASFVQIIDLDKDSAELWVDGARILSWPFSPGTTGTLKQLGAVNFSSIAVFRLDEVCFTAVGCPPNSCQDAGRCPVEVAGRKFNSRCEACCAGYTAQEWKVQEDPPRIRSFSNRREWRDSDDGNIFFELMPSDTTLFVDISVIDTIDFRPVDVLLSHYCPDSLLITVEDQRPDSTEEACYTFNVIWRVSLGSQLIDSLVLPVVVECKEEPVLDSLIFLQTNTYLVSGDTLQLTACPFPDSTDFAYVFQSCTPKIGLEIQHRNRRWIGSLPEGQQTTETPCWEEELVVIPSQCSFTGDPVTIYVQIYDRRGPSFTPPADTAIACIDELGNVGKTGWISAVFDSCGIMDTIKIDDLSRLDNCSGLVNRVFRVIDSCGRSTTAVQRIRVQDRIAPMFNPPGPVTINGLKDLNDLRVTGTVSNVRDNCGLQDTSYVDDRSQLKGCAGRIRRTWTVTDACGNRTSADQVITVIDDEAPQFELLDEVTLSCPADLDNPQLQTGIFNVTDNVGVADTIVTDDRSGLVGCEGVVIRSWRIVDSCGNETVNSQRIRITDRIAPTFVAPFAVTINCLEELEDLSITGNVLFVNDNCGILDTMYRDSTTKISDCIYQVVRTWTVRDRCGNATSRIQRITVADTEPPAFQSPPAARVRQRDLGNLAATGRVREVRDNCGIRDTSFTDTFIRRATCMAEGWVVRTWRVRDWCGNQAETSQDIFYTLEIPVANAGPDKVVTCQQPLTQLDGTASSIGTRYVYNWSTTDGRIISGANTPAPEVGAPGMYMLVVRDTVNRCEAVDQVMVSQQSDLQANLVSKTDLSCHGVANGTIAISPRGGRAPYRIRWSNGDTIPMLRNLPGGSYQVTVSDQGNCQSSLNVSVLEPDSLTLAITVLEGSSCSGAGTGRAEVSINGGTGPYRITWDNGETTPAAIRLSAGNHMITVRDANGCTAIQNFRVVEARPDASLGAFPDQCEGGAPLVLSGGLPAGGIYSGRGVSGGRFDPAAAEVGEHVIRYIYRAPNGCADTAQVSVKVNALPELTDRGLAPVCISTDTVRLNFIEPRGGSYRGTGISGGNLFRPSAAGPGSLPVLYTYRDPATGCTNSLATLVTVLQASQVSFDIQAPDTVVCQNDLLEVRAVVVNGGGDPVFSWQVNGRNQNLDSNLLKVSLPAGRYTLRGTVTSSLGCVAARIVADSITIRVDSVTIAVQTPEDAMACLGQGPILLKPGIPGGGTFTGSFVRDSLFQTELAGIGRHTVVYTLKDPVTGCQIKKPFEVMVERCTSRDLPPGVNALKIFPNPASDFLQIELAADQVSGMLFIELLDSQGRPLRRQIGQLLGGQIQERLAVDGLPGGVYWLRLRAEGFIVWRKVVVGR